jgi:hypothetical protein
MFDSLAWRRECYDHYLLGLDDEDELDEEFWTDSAEQPYEVRIDGDETLPTARRRSAPGRRDM